MKLTKYEVGEARAAQMRRMVERISTGNAGDANLKEFFNRVACTRRGSQFIYHVTDKAGRLAARVTIDFTGDGYTVTEERFPAS